MTSHLFCDVFFHDVKILPHYKNWPVNHIGVMQTPKIRNIRKMVGYIHILDSRFQVWECFGEVADDKHNRKFICCCLQGQLCDPHLWL